MGISIGFAGGAIAFLLVQMGPKGKAFGQPLNFLGNIKNRAQSRGLTLH